ncbi:MAG: D-2-hydroxyacid dehydrogenase [Gammaproteobacteria bacterium]|nr:D-2-hydroxyacid dehydrogenase [Gammaproteobacteria bacterium]
MSDCLIVTTVAREFAEEIERLADFPIRVRACTSAQEALAAYAGETVLFGSPGMIAEILPRLPRVRWVQSSWAGVTPLIELGRRDYVLTGVRDVFGPQMSEYVIGYLLAHELRILRRVKAQRGQQWLRDHSGMLGGKRLGIMGTGSIGRHIAATASCLGMRAVGLSRSGRSVDGFEQVFAVDRLYEFLGEVDHLVSVLPQTAGTDRLLDAGALACLPAGACFINVGRSNVVDHAALRAALSGGRLGCAVLDVFDAEPLPAGSPLWNTPDLLVTAHIAAISHPLLIVPVFVENYRRWINDRPLQYVIDFDAGY